MSEYPRSKYAEMAKDILAEDAKKDAAESKRKKGSS
jgi:hypothetical protein